MYLRLGLHREALDRFQRAADNFRSLQGRVRSSAVPLQEAWTVAMIDRLDQREYGRVLALMCAR
jgi:hypothetical protein